MPASLHPKRSQQPVTSGIGLAFTSPVKRRNEQKKSTIRVAPLAHAAKRQLLKARLAQLKAKPNPCVSIEPVDEQLENIFEDEVEDRAEVDMPQDCPDTTDLTPKARRVLPDAKANNLYRRWQELIPCLVDPYLRYIEMTIAKELQPVTSVVANCLTPLTCAQHTNKILCLFADRELLSEFQGAYLTGLTRFQVYQRCHL